MINRNVCAFLLARILALGVGCELQVFSPPLHSQETKPTSSDLSQLEASASQFESAFNKGELRSNRSATH